MFEGVYVTGARFSHAKALRLRKRKGRTKTEEKIKETIGGRRRTDSSVLGIESLESGHVPRVHL